MDIVATREDSHFFMNVSVLQPWKAQYYEAIGAVDYERLKGKNKDEGNGLSCFEILYESYAKKR